MYRLNRILRRLTWSYLQQKRLQVVYLYFCGLSNDQIAAKTSISKGSVTNIVSELKAGNFPEAADVTDQIETLRESPTRPLN